MYFRYLLYCLIVWLLSWSSVWAVDLDQCQIKNLIITAYYSPEKGQAFYINGTYDAEIKMNGHGSHGASGTPVYDGMLAGSSEYPFGTLVVIPKVGHGLIQDRGGAIISDPQGSGTNTEHIDIWVGKGTAGLMRALTRGRQSKKWYVCPKQKSKTIWFDIHKMPSYKYFFDVTLRAQRMSQGRKDQRVEALQKYLWKLWYIRQEDIHGNYNDSTKNAVCAFQVKYGIVPQDDPVCGTFGPKTSFSIKKEAQVRGLLPDDLYTLTTLQPIIAHLPATVAHTGGSWNNVKESDKMASGTSIVIQDISKLKGVKHQFYRYYRPTETNTEIIFLQQFLKQNGYYTGKINGINSVQTQEALYQFQLAFEILTSSSDQTLRGFLGPKTRDLINKTQVKP